MRIGIISPEFPPKLSGLANYVYYLSRTLVRKGHDVTVITRGGSHGFIREDVDGIKVIKAWFAPLYPFHVAFHGIFVNMILKAIEHELDVLHLHSGIPPLVKSELPKVVTIHTPLIVDSKYIEHIDPMSLSIKLFSLFIYRTEYRLIHEAELVTAVSKTTMEQLRNFYSCRPCSVVVVHNGVDTELFRPGKPEVLGDTPYILYTGRLDYRKGLFDLVDSAKYVCAENKDIRFVITGTGALEKALSKRVEKIGLNGNFILTGRVSLKQLIRLYQGATVYVLPSHQEGLPTALLEAMACGAPTVATTIGCNAEVITHGRNGLLVPVKSPRSIADAILVLLEDQKLRKRLGKAARETIAENYSWVKIAEKFEKCYEYVVGSRNVRFD